MSLGLLATPTVTICKAAKMVFNVAPGNFYLSQYLEYQEANGTSATVEALANLAGGTDAAFVTTVLTNLGLADDAGAQAFLESSIAASGRGAALEAAITALNNVAADDATYGSAKAQFDAAVIKSVTYSTVAANNSTDISVLAAAASVTVDDSGAVVVQPTVGTTFTLTSNADVFGPSSATAATKTTSGDDTFRSVNSGDFASADVIDAGAGTDALSFTETATVAGTTIKPLLTSVENIVFTGKGLGTNSADSVTVDLADSTGVESFTFKDSVGSSTNVVTTLTVDNIDSGIPVTISGGAAGTTDGTAAAVTVGVDGASTGTADALTINLVNANTGALTAANIEQVVISNSNTGDKKSTVSSLAVDKATSLEIGGAGDLTITAVARNDVITEVDFTGSAKVTTTFDVNSGTAATGKVAKLKTIDGSASTGNLDITLTAPIADTTVTLGSGEDKLQVADAAVINTAKGTTGAITGGDGKDTISLSDSGNNAAFDATETANLKKATGFEALEIEYTPASNETSISLSAKSLGFEEYVFSGAAVGKAGVTAAAASAVTDSTSAVTITGVEDSDAFVFSANMTGGTGATAASTDNTPAVTDAVSFAAELDDGSNEVTITLKSSSTVDTAKVVMTGGAGIADVTNANGKGGGDAISASEFETVNLISTGKSASTFTNAHDLAGGASATGQAAGVAITIGANGTLNVSGTKHIDLTDGVAGTNATVDASQLSGIIQVKTTAGNNTLIGGSNKDQLEGGSGVDSYTGGAGADTFVIAAGEAGITGNESISDFALNSDILNIATTTLIADTSSATDVSGAISSGVAADSLTASVSKGYITLSGNATAKIDTVSELKAIFELLDANNSAQAGAIQMGADTYVITDAASGNAGTADTVNDIIKLTGVSGAELLSTTAVANAILIS